MAATTMPMGPCLGGRYRIVRPLQTGGMATVYEGLQLDLRRRVAIKLLGNGLPAEALARFEREASTTARLGHPHIVQVTDFQTSEDEPPFLVMELLDGSTLREVLRREGTMPWRRAARIGLQVLAALMAAHAARIVHRDIKPENLFLVARAGVPDFVKVLDFGIAKLLEPPAGAAITRHGDVIGTVPYMAPEQIMGNDVDERTDLYAVAVCLYEAVSGRRPVEGSDRRSIATKAAAGVVVPLHSRYPAVDARFARIVMRALAKDPADRFPSAYAMAEALACILDDAPETPSAPPAPIAVPRTSFVLGAFAAILASACVGALVYALLTAMAHIGRG